jgi:hypothetical protein
MLANIIKNWCYQKFHQRIDEIQEEQKRNVEEIYIRLENLLENRYLTLNELSQFLKRGEDKGKQIVIPEEIPQPQEEKFSEPKETSDSTQLRIRKPSSFF